MKKYLLLLLFFIPFHLQAQFVNSNGKFNYLRIFVDTDDCESDYLDNLEKSQNKFWAGKMERPC